jgi:hypothetical protein
MSHVRRGYFGAVLSVIPVDFPLGLERTSSNMNISLIEPPLYSHDYNLGTRKPWNYKVGGLSQGDEAWIARRNHRWAFLHVSNGASSHWTGKTDTEIEALNDLGAWLSRPTRI